MLLPLPLRTAAVAVAVAVLAGCASRAPTAQGGRDGPGADPPADLARRPDATPRIEPLRSGGPNKPYAVFGQRYEPLTADLPLAETGGASWYGRKFHGRPTASGETYDMYAMTAAHKTMPIPSYAVVSNPANGRQVVVRINDRGPFVDGRVVDLSYTAALKLDLLRGVAPVQVRRLTFADIRALAGRRAPQLPVDDGIAGDAAPSGWWLQLAAFRSREAAGQLLQRALFEADTAVQLSEAAGVWRVLAGPYASREEALAAAARLRERLDLTALPAPLPPDTPGPR